MQEPLELSFRDVEKTDEIVDRIELRSARLGRFCDHIISCHVTVERPHKHEDQGSAYRVRVNVRVPPHHELVADQHSSQGDVHDDVRTVVNRAFDAMERQLRKLNAKQHEVDHKEPVNEPGIGTVFVIDHQKRYGIIKTPAGRDIFFNEGAVVNNDFDRIVRGTGVRYEDEPGDEGPRATTVQVVDKRGQPIVAG